MNVAETISLCPTHIRENADFSLQNPEQLLSAEVNFEGCLMVKYYMALIL